MAQKYKGKELSKNDVRVPKISSDKFMFENYQPDYWHVLGLNFSNFSNDDLFKNLEKIIIGWCNSCNVKCRPKTDHVAVLCKYEDEEVWFHVHIDNFYHYFKRKE